jgi:hypothetical protein
MLTRSRCVFGVSAALLSLSFVASAAAQNTNLGGQLQRQLINNVGNMLPGSQPMYPYQTPNYGAGQPYYSPYQGQPAGYGYQPQAGMMYNRQGLPYMGGGQTIYQQPGSNSYPYQQGRLIRTRPRYDRQLQPTSYTTPTIQRYQIPAQYSGTPAGYVINYGGRNYLSGSDGTMTPYNGPIAR